MVHCAGIGAESKDVDALHNLSLDVVILDAGMWFTGKHLHQMWLHSDAARFVGDAFRHEPMPQ